MIAKRFSHDHLPLSVAFGLESHFLHLLGEFLLVDFLLVLFAVSLSHDFSSVSVHNNSIFWVMTHLHILSFAKIKSIELVSHF